MWAKRLKAQPQCFSESFLYRAPRHSYYLEHEMILKCLKRLERARTCQLDHLHHVSQIGIALPSNP